MTDSQQKSQYAYDVTRAFDEISRKRGLALAMSHQTTVAASTQPSTSHPASEDTREILAAAVAVLGLLIILGVLTAFVLAFAGLLLLLLFVGFSSCCARIGGMVLRPSRAGLWVLEDAGGGVYRFESMEGPSQSGATGQSVVAGDVDYEISLLSKYSTNDTIQSLLYLRRPSSLFTTT
ncbi:hypothetical protein OE88DRAFT_1644646 [Heliocybe sulcata]|uniref:Uncharacterized protein n=1 Tax=Heliocybe sulcata TaxID=5364 RepID=A0A5C3N6E0_9AGAM|nr:hypothetical protein OE88DRAFT_1644646 [Heliocybe sulcata]